MRRWVSGIDKSALEERREKAFGLWLSYHTQAEIAEAVNVPQQTIADMVKGFTEIAQLSNSGQVAATFGDFQRLYYNVWPDGMSVREIVEHLLWAYTDPFDVVVDPFCGGDTIDVCRERFRRYHVSDLTPIISRENEIRQNDLTASLPTVPRWNAVTLVYLDPPYWKQAEGWYGDSPSNLANMDADTFHATLAAIINGFADKLQPGAKIAMLMQPTQWKAPERGFVDHVAAISKGVDLPIVQRVQCPYESQQATEQMVEWAKANKQWLVLSRELVIWETR